MALPSVTHTFQDGGLGTIPANYGGVLAVMGISARASRNVIGSYADMNTAYNALGPGPLTEAAAYLLSSGAKQVYTISPTISSAGSCSAVTHAGTGTGVLTVAAAPDRQILIKITTAGTLGTAAYAYSVGGGAYSAPVLTTETSYAAMIPGTLCTVTFPAGTYEINEVYTIATTGVVTKTASGPTITQVSSPCDRYGVRVEVTKDGAIAAATFRYSLDHRADTDERLAANTWSADITVPGSPGRYVIANSGIVLTFSDADYDDGDTYDFTTTAAAYDGTALTTAWNVLKADSRSFEGLFIVGQAATSSAAATIASAVDTDIAAGWAAFKFVWALMECPGSESDATILASFASFSSAYGKVSVGVGDVDVTSPLSGRRYRRTAAWCAAARASIAPIHRHLGAVKDGAITGCTYIYRDEAATPGLDDGRFITMRSLPGKSGYYITRPRTMAAQGSDYHSLHYVRITCRASTIAHAIALGWLNDNARVDEDSGFIDIRDAAKMEGEMNAGIRADLKDSVTQITASVSRTCDLLSGASQVVNLACIPFAYLEQVELRWGFANPALA